MGHNARDHREQDWRAGWLGCLAALLCALAAPAAAAPATAGAAGEYESNDSRADAYGPLEGGAEYAATFETDNDSDWFFFYVASDASQIDISATGSDGSNCDASVSLLDADGKLIEFFYLPVEDETNHLHVTLDAGQYYLNTDNYANGLCTGDEYTLRLDPAGAITTMPPPPDEPAIDPIPPGVNPPTIIPRPTLLAGPKGRTSRRHASFRFWSNHPAGRLQCKLTGQRVPTRLKHWRRCTSPKHYTGLRLGKKVFWVRELDRGKSSKSVRRRWIVIKKPMNIVATRRAAFIRINCSLPRKRCKARIVIKAGKRILARGRYSLPPDKTQTARLGLTKAGRRALSRSKRVWATATFIDIRTGKQKMVSVVLRARSKPQQLDSDLLSSRPQYPADTKS